MVQLFLVCALIDRSVARVITKALAELGYTVAPPALNTVSWSPKIHATAEEAKCVLVLWTDHSVCSQAVCADAIAAAERGALVQIVAGSNLSEHCIEGAPAVDFVGWDGAAAGQVWASLLTHVKARCGPPPNPHFDVAEIAPRLLLGLVAAFSFALAAQILFSNHPKSNDAAAPQSPAEEGVGQTYNLPPPPAKPAAPASLANSSGEGVGGPMVEDSSDGDEGKQLKGLPPRLDDAPSHPAAEPAPAPHKRAKAEPEI